MAHKILSENLRMTLTEEEETTIMHYRGYCHDSRFCVPCKSERDMAESFKAAMREIATGR